MIRISAKFWRGLGSSCGRAHVSNVWAPMFNPWHRRREKPKDLKGKSWVFSHGKPWGIQKLFNILFKNYIPLVSMYLRKSKCKAGAITQW